MGGDDAEALGAWRLPDELVALADTVRRFMESEVRPLEDTLPHDATGLPSSRTMQAPQKPSRQTGLAPVKKNSSRSTSTSGLRGSLADTRSSPLIFNRTDIACSSGFRRSRLFAHSVCGFAHEIGKNFQAIPSRRLDTVASAQSCAMVLRFFGRMRPIERVADQFGFQFVPAPCRRLDRSDGSTGVRDDAGCIQRYSKAENGNRIVAGFPQRQPHMHRTPRRAPNDDAPHKPTRREACPNLEKATQRNLLSSARPMQFDLGIETQQRRHEVCGRKICRAKIPADCRHLPDGWIGRIAGGQGERPAVGH